MKQEIKFINTNCRVVIYSKDKAYIARDEKRVTLFMTAIDARETLSRISSIKKINHVPAINEEGG